MGKAGETPTPLFVMLVPKSGAQPLLAARQRGPTVMFLRKAGGAQPVDMFVFTES